MILRNVKVFQGHSISAYLLFMKSLYATTTDGLVLKLSMQKCQEKKEYTLQKAVMSDLRGLNDLTSMHAGFGHIMVVNHSKWFRRATICLLTQKLRKAASLEIKSYTAFLDVSMFVKEGLRVILLGDEDGKVRIYSYFKGRLEELRKVAPAQQTYRIHGRSGPHRLLSGTCGNFRREKNRNIPMEFQLVLAPPLSERRSHDRITLLPEDSSQD